MRKPVTHYMAGRWEVIDVISGMIPKDLTPYQGFLWGNAVKYIMRFMYKGAKTADLHKCTTYLTWLREDISKGERHEKVSKQAAGRTRPKVRPLRKAVAR